MELQLLEKLLFLTYFPLADMVNNPRTCNLNFLVLFTIEFLIYFSAILMTNQNIYSHCVYI